MFRHPYAFSLTSILSTAVVSRLANSAAITEKPEITTNNVQIGHVQVVFNSLHTRLISCNNNNNNNNASSFVLVGLKTMMIITIIHLERLAPTAHGR